VEAAVGVQVGWVLAVELHPFFVGDKHRNLGAILAGVEHLRSQVLVRLHIHLRRLKYGALVGSRVVLVNSSGVRKRREGVVQLLVGAAPAEAPGRADGGQGHVVLVLALFGVHLHLRAGVVQVGSQQVTACLADAFELFLSFRNHCFPAGRLRVLGVDAHHFVVGRVVVGIHQQLAANVADYAGIVLVASLYGSPGAGLLGIGEVAHQQLVAIGLAVGERKEEEALVLPAVVEALTGPRDVRHLHPVELIGQGLAGLHVEQVHLLPVRAAAAGGVGQVAVVMAEVQAGQRCSAIGRKLVGVEQHHRAFERLTLFHGVKHGLVLQTIVLAKNQQLAFLLGHAVALVAASSSKPAAVQIEVAFIGLGSRFARAQEAGGPARPTKRSPR
nr:hypothetical protein [Tanacetum cinerariifolium]